MIQEIRIPVASVGQQGATADCRLLLRCIVHSDPVKRIPARSFLFQTDNQYDVTTLTPSSERKALTPSTGTVD